VHVGADQRADPFAERVAVAGRARGFQTAEQVAVGDALGGEGAAGGECVEPEGGDVVVSAGGAARS